MLLGGWGEGKVGKNRNEFLPKPHLECPFSAVPFLTSHTQPRRMCVPGTHSLGQCLPYGRVIWFLTCSVLIKHITHWWFVEKSIHLTYSPVWWVRKSYRSWEFKDFTPKMLQCRAFCNYMKGRFLLFQAKSTRMGIICSILYVFMSF